jgi:hypothetical protein
MPVDRASATAVAVLPATATSAATVTISPLLNDVAMTLSSVRIIVENLQGWMGPDPLISGA